MIANLHAQNFLAPTDWNDLPEGLIAKISRFIAHDEQSEIAEIRAINRQWLQISSEITEHLSAHRLDNALAHRFSKLRSLHIEGVAFDRIAPRAGERLAQLTNLTELKLSEASVDELESIGSLSTLTKLTRCEITVPRMEDFTQVLQKLSNLRPLTHLKLLGGYFRDSQMAPLSACSRLESLEFESFSAIFAKSLSVLSTLHLTKLTWVDNNLEDGDFDHLLTLTDLRSLTLTGNSTLDSDIYECLSDFKQLQELNLSETKVDSETVKCWRSLKNLTSLNLSKCTELKAQGIRKLTRFSQLQVLNLSENRDLELPELKRLSALMALKELELSYVEIPGEALEFWGSLTGLTKLGISWCETLSPRGFELLKTFHELREIDLCATKGYPIEALNALGSLSRLQCINLDFTDITDEGVGHLRGLTQLTKLTFCECLEITKLALGILQQLVNLKHLDLDDCRDIDAGGFGELTKLTELRELHVSYTECSDVDLHHFRGFRRLRFLRLYGCKLPTSASVDSIVHISKLQTLNLGGCEAITAGNFRNLSQMQHLRDLQLSRTSVSKQDLDALAASPSLSSVTLNRGFSAEDLSRLQSRCHVREIQNF